jgi:pimeloyl-ACP methyl ester carboxylesterase
MGDRDVARPEHAVLMFRLIPNSQLVILPDTDHMKIVNRSDWLLPMIKEFLDLPMPQTQRK